MDNDDTFTGILSGNRPTPSTEASVQSFLGEDLVSMTRDPRRDRARRAASDEHLKSPLVKEIIHYLADKTFAETQAIRDTIIGGAWETLYNMRASKSS